VGESFAFDSTWMHDGDVAELLENRLGCAPSSDWRTSEVGFGDRPQTKEHPDGQNTRFRTDTRAFEGIDGLHMQTNDMRSELVRLVARLIVEEGSEGEERITRTGQPRSRPSRRLPDDGTAENGGGHGGIYRAADFGLCGAVSFPAARDHPRCAAGSWRRWRSGCMRAGSSLEYVTFGSRNSESALCCAARRRLPALLG
jgi:hypothetical protein